MGRHGTGGSEDAHERGDSAFWGPDNQQSDSFWSKDEQQEPPGWPSLPDQPEVTGQWAPMPRRDTPPPAPGFQSDPLETTGAFAVPPRPGPEPGRPQDEQPFETTGAFARPASWDESPESTQAFGGPPEDPHGAFRPPQDGPYAGDQQSGFPLHQGDAFGDPRGGFGPEHDPFGAQGGFQHQGDFRPGQDDDPHGPYRPPQDDPFGAEATGRFEAPGLPPEPGDVKVAGEPTMVARTPAWAEAETGFLGSGWSGEEQGGQEPRRGRGRRKPPKDPDRLDAPSGGRGRMALLSVAAVAVVLGGTVAGVKMMSSPGGETGCPGGQCAAVQSSQPGPQSSEPAVEEETADAPEDEEETPAEEPTEKEARPDPTPADTYSPTTRRTGTPTPKPTKTKSKAPVEEDLIDEPAVEAIPEEDPTTEPTDEMDSLDEADNASFPTEGVPQPQNTPSGEASTSATKSSPMSGGGSSVNVRFDVDRQRLAGYTATMSVTNDSSRALSSFTLSMPVRGKVLNVYGADWTQDGDLLIVDMSALATGETADVRISATGRGRTPPSCGMVGGECSVT